MKLTTAQIKKLIRLAEGESIPSSQMKGEWVDAMLEECVLTVIAHKSRVSYRLKSEPAFKQFLLDRYNIKDLNQTFEILQAEDTTRSEQVKVSGDSKLKRHRTMKGFLVTSLEPIKAILNDKEFVINPPEGSFLYIYDYESFRIPDDVLVVGVENSENFRYLSLQTYLFPKQRILFAARYPASGDFPKWLAMIDNKYLHFGDFDLAGIHIFLSEIYCVVGNRASFLIPDDIEERLKNGISERYDKQQQYKDMKIEDVNLKRLFLLIHKYRKGYDQEGFIL